MAASTPAGSAEARSQDSWSAIGGQRVSAAGWLPRLSHRRRQRAASRGSRVLFPSGGRLLLPIIVILALMACEVTWDDCMEHASNTAVKFPDLGPGLYPTVVHHRRHPIKPTWCCWLLASFLLSGDIETNPGPAARMRTIGVYCQNTCSLKNKLATLRSHAGELGGYDVVALSETWLGPHVLDSELQLGFPEHVWFRRDRDGRGGGVACAVKAGLSIVHRPDLEPGCEVLVVQVGMVHPTLIAVCYRPPDADRDVDTITAFIRKLHVSGLPFLLVGDFNFPEIRWTDNDDDVAILLRRTARAVTFIDTVAECEAVQTVTSPTRGENILDLAVSHGGNAVSEVCDGVFASDHKAVVTRYSVKCLPVPRATRSRAYNYKQADFTGLRTALRRIPWNVLTTLNVDDAVCMFYDLVHSAMADFIPMFELRKKISPMV